MNIKPLSATLTLIALWAAITITFIGCTSTSQRTAYNTIWSVEQTATVAMDDYMTLVIKKTVRTNDVPAVALKFNQFQSAAKVAADAAQAGTNALAPGSLVIELTDLTTFITAVESKK